VVILICGNAANEFTANTATPSRANLSRKGFFFVDVDIAGLLIY
jgi:hypothetical protein